MARKTRKTENSKKAVPKLLDDLYIDATHLGYKHPIIRLRQKLGVPPIGYEIWEEDEYILVPNDHVIDCLIKCYAMLDQGVSFRDAHAWFVAVSGHNVALHSIWRSYKNKNNRLIKMRNANRIASYATTQVVKEMRSSAEKAKNPVSASYFGDNSHESDSRDTEIDAKNAVESILDNG